jgi:hypothetical protein
VAAVLGTAAHHSFELGSGIGLVFQPELGLAGSGALWSIQLPLWAAMAARGSTRFDRQLAVLSGTALGGALVHFFIWPWHRNRYGLPVLTEAEGLDQTRLGAYNAVLYAWGCSAAASIIFEQSPRTRRWSLVALAATPALALSAKHHFRWINQQARENPAWWNRGVQPAVS